jgi:M6 family metalloprotease-like protein
LDISGASKNSTLRNLANSNAKDIPQMNNIIICIGFSDTQEMTHQYPYVDGMFNTNPNNNMRDYFSTMSYGKLDIVSHFYPPADGTTLRFYKDSRPRNYYKVWSENNPDGYTTGQQRTTREHTLLRNAIQWINANHPIPTNLNLDIDNNGACDFITFIIQGDVEGWSDLLWPHMSVLWSFDVKINGKQVWEYNFELDGSSWYFNVGTFCHEGYHVLGAPDLYHYMNIRDSIDGVAYNLGQAVGAYDIMESTSLKPQSMSAYMKYEYGRWIPELPTATINKTYEIYPFYTNDGTDSDKPVIYRIPMSGSTIQYSAVEYRKRTGSNYDSSLPNEGLMIYRINSTMYGNAGFDGSVVDEVFLYRPGIRQKGTFYTGGNLNQAPFNPANGRTEFNSTTDPKPCLSNGTESTQNINNIIYHDATDSYTFFYGDPADMEIMINKNELVIGKLTGSPGTATIISNILWHVNIPESASDWLTVSKTMGMNNDRVRFVAKSDNNTGIPKSTIVTFTGYGKTVYLTVIQDIVEAVCYEEISNLNVNIDKDARLATLTWDAPFDASAPKSPKKVLWNNTEGETSAGILSSRWTGGNDRVVIADDFDVPDDISWSIEEIYISGRQNGTSPLPDFIGISIYEDNGNKRPKSTPIYEKINLIPEEGIISGKMNIILPEPIIISEPGKYWISIYGTYEGSYANNKQFHLTNTSRVVGERMCMWDPTGVVTPLYPEWTPAVSSSDLQYGIFFSLSGAVSYPDRIMYNIYLDDHLIAADVKRTSFQYPVRLSEDHDWCVVAVCTSSMEGIEVCHQTEGILYDFSITAYPLIGGAASAEGVFGHGETILATAAANNGYKFANWTVNRMIVSTDNPYSFTLTEDMAMVANFELVIPFDDYVVTKWNNSFMLNIRQLEFDGYDLVSCKWYKNDKNGVPQIIGEGFTYSAGNYVTDLLEVGAAYSFELTTYSRGNVHSTHKIIEEKLSTLRIYPNPVPLGNKLTIEGTVEGGLVEVYNSMGACIMRTTATGSVTTLTLAVPVGLYVVRSNNEEVKVIIN